MFLTEKNVLFIFKKFCVCINFEFILNNFLYSTKCMINLHDKFTKLIFDTNKTLMLNREKKYLFLIFLKILF